MATKDIAKAYVQIIPSAEGIKGSISKVLDPEASSAGISAGNNIVSSLGGAIMKGLAALGIEKIIEQAVWAGADLEQSFGGLETIYGDAADAAKKYAVEAAQAGLSANDYAEQAVSFGASLKQAFGGDTAKAVEAANTAIMDMTDNAAKMGTPIENIQNAYQGFAKQNYTMLDNLKLGYGGTKTEMERLLKDAEKLSGVKYDISNLGDVYDAIHVIQTELGLTGVAAKEGAETISGSFNAAKASITNFLASVALGEDLEVPLKAMLTNISNFLLNNLVPALWNIVKAIPGTLIMLLNEVVPIITDAVHQLFASLPEFLQTGVEIVNNIVNGILEKLPEFISTAGDLLTKFVTYVLDHLPEILEAGAQILLNLVAGIIKNFPAIMEAVYTAMIKFVAAVAEKLPTILETGIRIIGQLVAGLIQAIPKIIQAIPQITSTIKNQLGKFDWVSIGINIIRGIANGITSAVGFIVNAARSAAQQAFNAAKNFLGISSPSKLFEKGVGKWIPAGIAEGITKNADVITEAMDGVTGLALSTFNTVSPEPATGIRGDVNITVYGAEGQDVEELAEIVSRKISDQIEGMRLVYA